VVAMVHLLVNGFAVEISQEEKPHEGVEIKGQEEKPHEDFEMLEVRRLWEQLKLVMGQENSGQKQEKSSEASPVEAALRQAGAGRWQHLGAWGLAASGGTPAGRGGCSAGGRGGAARASGASQGCRRGQAASASRGAAREVPAEAARRHAEGVSKQRCHAKGPAEAALRQAEVGRWQHLEAWRLAARGGTPASGGCCSADGRGGAARASG